MYTFQNQARGLWRWMEDMEVFLQAETAGMGDLDTLEAQLSESNVSSFTLHYVFTNKLK